MTRAETLDAAKGTEVWEDIPDCKHYQVSNRGRVRSLARVIRRNNGRQQTIRERILKQSLDEWGYPMVRLYGKTYKVHRLVAAAFILGRKPGEVIRHMDGNPKNNHVSNLAYGTTSENILDCYDYRGCIRKRQKLTEQDASQIKSKLANGIEGKAIAKEYGVSPQTICDIKHNRIYKRVV